MQRFVRAGNAVIDVAQIQSVVCVQVVPTSFCEVRFNSGNALELTVEDGKALLGALAPEKKSFFPFNFLRLSKA